jgi:hypothetical protein
MLGLCSIYFSKLQKEQMNSVIFEVLENVMLTENVYFYLDNIIYLSIMDLLRGQFVIYGPVRIKFSYFRSFRKCHA